jgi:NAD(P)-dependent dehydrogenase (short-subunit alcohol dehydrogenase family)
LNGCVVLVVDATTGVGRIVTTRLCAAGAAVAVVGAGHPERGDDAATNAAFLCKELTDIGLIALPYQADSDRIETFRSLPAQIAADLGPVAASVVVIPSGPGSEGLARAFRTMSAAVAAALPAGAQHIEVDTVRDTEGPEELAQRVVRQLLDQRLQNH